MLEAMPMTRRTLLRSGARGALGLTALALLTACGGSAAKPNDAAAPAGAAATTATAQATPTTPPGATQSAVASPAIAASPAAPASPTRAASPALASPAVGASPAASAGSIAGIPQGHTSDGFYYLGESTAQVTIIDYADFLCPTCRQYVLTVEPDVIKQYVRPGKVKIVFRDVLNFGERSERASEAAASAGKQGLFWDMHAILYAEQPTIENTSTGKVVPLLKELAKRLDTLNQDLFARSMDERETIAAIKSADAEQRTRGITSQPIFEIGAHRLVGLQSFESMQRAIDEALK